MVINKSLIGRATQTIREHNYLPVILEVRPTPNCPKTIYVPQKTEKLQVYLEKTIAAGRSTSQIADEIGASKTWVIETLQRYEIEIPKTGRMTNPDNYRHHTPPFGMKVRGGKLIPEPKQQKVCKEIVNLRNIEGLSFNAIAKELREKMRPNASGTHYWDHKGVKKIFDRWKDKF